MKKFLKVVLAASLLFSGFGFAANSKVEAAGTPGVVKEVIRSSQGVIILATNGDVFEVAGTTATKKMSGVKKIYSSAYETYRAGGSYFAVKEDDSLWSWGANGIYGSLGQGVTDATIDTPAQIMTDVDKVYVNNTGTTLVLKKDKSLWSFGKGDLAGQGGANVSVPSPVVGVGGTGTLTNVDKVYVDYTTTYAVSNNRLYYWGSLAYGVPLATYPTLVPTIPDLAGKTYKMYTYDNENSRVAEIGGSTVVFEVNGSQWYWGIDVFATPVTNGQTIYKTSPTAVPNGTKLGSIFATFPSITTTSAGSTTHRASSFSVFNGDSAYILGHQKGMLQSWMTPEPSFPVYNKTATSTITDVEKVTFTAAGEYYIKKDKTLWASGTNAEYQISNSFQSINAPVRVTDPTNSIVDVDHIATGPGGIWVQEGVWSGQTKQWKWSPVEQQTVAIVKGNGDMWLMGPTGSSYKGPQKSSISNVFKAVYNNQIYAVTNDGKVYQVTYNKQGVETVTPVTGTTDLENGTPPVDPGNPGPVDPGNPGGGTPGTGGSAEVKVDATLPVNGGSISVNSAQMNFSSVVLKNGTTINSNSTSKFTVDDSSGTGGGWNVKMSATDFVMEADDPTASGKKVKLAIPADRVQFNVAGFTSVYGDMDFVTNDSSTKRTLLTTPQKLVSATPGYGMGTYEGDLQLEMTIPDKVKVVEADGSSSYKANDQVGIFAGSYVSTVTITVSTGP